MTVRLTLLQHHQRGSLQAARHVVDMPVLPVLVVRQHYITGLSVLIPGAYPRIIKGFIPRKLRKSDFTIDAEYVANLVNVNICGCQRVTLQFITRVCYACITTFC